MIRPSLPQNLLRMTRCPPRLKPDLSQIEPDLLRIKSDLLQIKPAQPQVSAALPRLTAFPARSRQHCSAAKAEAEQAFCHFPQLLRRVGIAALAMNLGDQAGQLVDLAAVLLVVEKVLVGL